MRPHCRYFIVDASKTSQFFYLKLISVVRSTYRPNKAFKMSSDCRWRWLEQTHARLAAGWTPASGPGVSIAVLYYTHLYFAII